MLAIKGGVPVETALEVMLNSVIASPSLKYRTPFILNMPEEAWFNVNMMQKDMLLAEEMGRELDVPLPTVASATNCSPSARAMGLAKRISPLSTRFWLVCPAGHVTTVEMNSMSQT